MFKLTKASRYMEENMVKQFCQRAAPTQENTDIIDVSADDEFTLVTGKNGGIKPDLIRSDATIIDNNIAHDNYYSVLSEIEMPELHSDAQMVVDSETEITSEVREDHFVLYEEDVLIHWQLINGLDLVYVGRIDEPIDVPLYLSEGSNICNVTLKLFCKCPQDRYTVYPYDQDMPVSFVAFDQSVCAYTKWRGPHYCLHSEVLPKITEEKVIIKGNKKNKNKNKTKGKKLKPWQKRQPWKECDVLAKHVERIHVTYPWEIRVREHVVSMKKNCASLAKMKEDIPVKLQDEFHTLDGADAKDIQGLISHYHKELHGDVIEEPIQILMRIMKQSTAKNESLGMFEDIMLTLVALRYSNNIAGIIAILTMFAKKMIPTNDSILHFIVETFTEEVGSIFGCDVTNEKELQGDCDGTASYFTDTFNKFKSYTLHPSKKHIATIVSALVTVGLMKPQYITCNGFKLFAAQAFDKTTECSDIVDVTLQSIAFFLDTGFECFKKFSFDPFFKAVDTVSEFRTLVHFLHSNIDVVKLGNYELLHNESLDEYQNKMVRARQMVGSVIPNAMYTKSELSVDVNKLTKVELEHSFFLQSQGLRETPYAILLYGPSGVGKSYLMRKLTEHILMVNGFNHDESAYCFLNCHSKFYDSLKSNTQCICLDEIANANPSVNQVNECDFILNILNNVFFAAPMAEAHQKGKVMVNNKVFASTTNVPNINAEYWSQEPLAVLRRFQCRITANVLPEFARGQMLDVDKALSAFPNDKLQDVWNFTVEQAYGIVDSKDKASIHPRVGWKKMMYQGKILQNIGIIELMQWLVEHSRKHFSNQKAVLSRSKNKMAICEKCKMFCEICPCPVIEKEEITPVPTEDKELHVGFLTNMVNAAVREYIVNPWYDTVTSSIKQGFTDMFDILLPTYTERKLYNMSNQIQAIANWKYFNKSRFNWMYEIFPHWLLATDTFEHLYMYLERKNMVKFWKHSMLAITAGVVGVGAIEWKTHDRPRVKVLGGMFAAWSIMNVSSAVYVHKRFEQMLIERRDASYIREQARKELQGESCSYDWRVKAFRVLGGATAVAVGMTLISTIIVTYDVWKKRQQESHSLLNPQNMEELKERDVTKNPWRSIPVFSDEQKATYTAEQLSNSISGNMLGIIVNGRARCSAVMLCSDVMIMPYHMWYDNFDMKGKPNDKIIVTVVSAPFEKNGKPVSGNVCDIELDWDCCYRVPKNDLVVCHVLTGPRKDLRPYLSEEGKLGQYISVRRSAQTGELVKGYGVTTGFMADVWPGSDCAYVQYENKHNVDWKAGDCCTVIISNDALPRILGMHLIGIKENALQDHKKGFSAVLVKSEINSAIESLKKLVGLHELHAEGVLPLTVCGKSISFKNEDCVSPLNWICKDVSQPVFTYYGTVGGGASATSKVRTSMIAHDLSHVLGVPNIWGPPNFNPPDENGIRRKWIPWHIGLKNLTNPCHFINSAALKWAIADFSKPLYDSLDRFDNIKICPLNKMEILNGIDGKRFIDKMNFKTSMGFPLLGSKSKYLVCDPITGKMDFIDPIFWEEYDKATVTYLKGYMCNHIFKACLKDEVTKVKDSTGSYKKARIFQAAPIIMQLMLRKYFMPIVWYFCMNPLLSECAVGINCVSLEWEELVSHMTKYLDNEEDRGVFGGDYAAWDQRCPNQLVVASMTVMINFARKTGNYSDEDIIVMKGLMTDLSYCLINYNGSLLRFRGMMPSGHNLTAVLNSNANSLLVRAMYYEMCKQHNICPVEFRSVVAISTYGDDVFGSVHKSIRHIFNIKTYSHLLMERVGMGFTMPDKKAQLVEFIKLSDEGADFLKRQSRYVPGLVDNNGVPVRVGVIDIESIIKSLYCVKCSKTQEKNNLSATMLSALHELFFHGEFVYNQWTSILSKICVDHQIILPIDIPSFEERIDDWKEKYLNKQRGKDGALSEDIGNNFLINDHPIDVLVTHGCYHEAYIDEQTLEDLVVDKSSRRGFLGWNPFSLNCKPSKVNEENNIYEGVSNQYAHCLSLQRNDLQLHADGSEVVTSFNIVDGDSSSVGGIMRDINLNTQHTPSDLKEFFRRPIKIKTFELGIDENIAIDIDPVTDYLANKRVSNRINNYAWFSGTMCVKFETNGSNFHYGRYIAAINHQKESDSVYQQTGVPMTACTVMPHIMIDPTDASGGCLEIPLFHPMNMIPFRNVFDLVTVHVRSINPLKLLKVSDPVNAITLNVWAWFKDIELSMPTQANNSFLEPQGLDEYDKPSVIATSVADTIGALRQTPVIGPYAKATETALRGAAKVASIFGYSRPNVTNDNGRMIIHPIGNIANTNVVDTTTKLALDGKQEVTIDSAVTGYVGEDSMNIANIAKKRMLIEKMDWEINDTVGNAKFLMNVTPMMTKQTVLPDTGGASYLISPACHMAAPFKYWRGSMEVTIEVVASTFHKGKLRVVYDPLGVMANDGTDWLTEYNVNYSAVIDIAQSRTYTMRIGWGNARSYCLTGDIARINSLTDQSLADLASVEDNSYANGRLGIHVLTPLTSVAGVDTNLAYINVYVNMCDDFQIATPQCGEFTNWSTNAPQTVGEDEDFKYQGEVLQEVPGPMVAEDSGMQMLINDTNMDSALWESKYNRTHIGEEIKSIAQVIKRYSPSTYLPFQVAYDIMAPAVGDRIYFQMQVPNFPQYGGWSTTDFGGGPPNPFVVVNGGGVGFIPVPFTNWLTWYSPGFLMRRGSIRQKYVIEGGNTSDFQIEGYYIINSPTASGLQIQTGSILPASATTSQILRTKGSNFPTVTCGAFTNYPVISNVLDGETPFQSDRRWFNAQNRNMEEEYLPYSLRHEGNHKVYCALAVANENTTGGLRRYTAAGEDFSFVYYKYPPLVVRAEFG